MSAPRCGFKGCDAPAVESFGSAGDIKLCMEHAEGWRTRAAAVASGGGRPAIQAFLSFYVKAQGGAEAAAKKVLGRL